jgi:hypothetical protein
MKPPFERSTARPGDPVLFRDGNRWVRGRVLPMAPSYHGIAVGRESEVVKHGRVRIFRRSKNNLFDPTKPIRYSVDADSVIC